MATFNSPFSGNPVNTSDLFGGLGFNSMFSLLGSSFSAQSSALGAKASAISVQAGATADLFQAEGAIAHANLKAEGVNLNAAGTRIKAEGDLAEATNYDLSAALARKNKQYATESTAIQEFQLNRKTNMFIGGQKADFAGAGLKESGSALDLLAESASQGALAKSVLQKQG